MSFLYRSLLRLLRRVGGLFIRSGSKLGRGLEGRRSARARLTEWGEGERDASRPVVWFHAPSVGEGLQARAVIEELRALQPAVQVVYTYFSPSAAPLGESMPAEVATYLPWDLPDEVVETLDVVRPDLLVFTKTEVWPVLTAEAVARGVPVGIVGATVSDGSSRARWPARALLAPAWASLSFACANSEEDSLGLEELGVPEGTITITGDPGIDSATDRVDAADEGAPFLAPFLDVPRPTVVAGSTWPAGEGVLLPALRTVKRSSPQLRLVIAPHEPSEGHVSDLMERLAADGWQPIELSEVERTGGIGDHDAVVVDGVGKLAQLYTIGDIAYVGGGFHDSGLHSVLEPAAAALPTVFGPRHGNSRAATDLLEAGGAKIAANTDEMAGCLSEWLGDDELRAAAGKQAFRYIDRHRGAAERTAKLLEPLLEKDRLV